MLTDYVELVSELLKLKWLELHCREYAEMTPYIV